MRQSAVVGFVAENANRVLYYNSVSLNYHFEQRGYASIVIDLMQPDWLQQLRQFGTIYEIEFCYGFAGIGAHLKLGDKSLWEEYCIPFLSLLHDHPFYFPDHHSVPSNYVCNCYAVRDFLDVQRDYIRSPQPCAELKIASNGYSPADAGRPRDIPALFLKTGYDLATLDSSFNVMPAAFRSIVFDCIHAAQTNPDLVLTDLVRDAFLNLKLDYRQGRQAWDDFVYLVRVIDMYLRHWRSNQLVEALKHLPVLIVGGGWDHVDKAQAKASFLPATPSLEADKLLRRSKFILNVHPYGRYAWHERVFCALEIGAAAISDRTRFTDEHFADLPNFLHFDWADAERFNKIESFVVQMQDRSFDVEPAAKRLAERFPPHAAAAWMIDTAAAMREDVAGWLNRSNLSTRK